MAIVESAIDVGTISTLTSLDLSRVSEEGTVNTDTTKKIVTNKDGSVRVEALAPKITNDLKTLGTANAINTNDISNVDNSIFSDIKVPEPSIGDKLIGLFTPSTDCNTKAPSKYRSTYSKSSNNRSLKKVNHNCDQYGNPVTDVIVGLKDYSAKEDILNAFNEPKVDSAISDTLKTSFKDINSYTDPSKVVSATKSNLLKLTQQGGSTLKAKSILNDALTLCKSKNSLNLNTSSLFDLSYIKSLLENIACDLDNALHNVLVSVIGIDPTQSTSALQAVTSILGDSNNKSVIGNLGVIQELRADVGGAKATAITKTKFSSILKGIDRDESKTANATETNDVILTSLDTIDPTWDRDELGNVNYFKLNGNDKVCSTSQTALLDNYGTTPSDGTVTVQLDRTQSISVMSAFA